MKDYLLNNGISIPALGFGTWRAKDGEEAYQAVLAALKAGYRHIDTAAIYQNEESVGRAIRDSGLPREELFITTKLWNDAHGYEEAKAALAESLSKLGLDYVDLYLIHWPNPKPLRDNLWQAANSQAWRAMEELYQAGKIRAIGVSNFLEHHLDALLDTATIVPAVNQIRLAPGVYQESIVDYCRKRGILLEAWGPFGQGELFSRPDLQVLAEKYGKTPAQLALAWSLQEGFLPLPKSVTPSRIVGNLDCFDIDLKEQDAQFLKNLSGLAGTAPNPDAMDF
ncbi:aldo/keto reductase [Streptococcus oricebi]|uniref:2,5-diketo-D-gluconic acid reductase n=1 Tax=Streptococcus oricebi TaxID=1547447 RepID=A0ABS5B3U9_9STRE|nr:aldo/keto reductase [Streptococcus oricebi]MBP2623499.1 2,5-diketo-D-gluconic acid reductase [Streptococcus oricebi]